MLPYGMNKKEYANNSKKIGDYSNSNTGNAVYSSVGTRNALRIFKKRARRISKTICLSGLFELDEEIDCAGL